MDSPNEYGCTKDTAIVLSDTDSTSSSPVKLLGVSCSARGNVTLMSDSLTETLPKEEPILVSPEPPATVPVNLETG